jgi:hypothetical protein
VRPKPAWSPLADGKSARFRQAIKPDEWASRCALTGGLLPRRGDWREAHRKENCDRLNKRAQRPHHGLTVSLFADETKMKPRSESPANLIRPFGAHIARKEMDFQEAPMRRIGLTIPEIAFIAGTRGALGFGAALLLSSKINERRRRTLGWGLVGLGVATTIPAARKLLQRRDSAAVTA